MAKSSTAKNSTKQFVYANGNEIDLEDNEVVVEDVNQGGGVLASFKGWVKNNTKKFVAVVAAVAIVVVGGVVTAGVLGSKNVEQSNTIATNLSATISNASESANAAIGQVSEAGEYAQKAYAAAVTATEKVEEADTLVKAVEAYQYAIETKDKAVAYAGDAWQDVENVVPATTQAAEAIQKSTAAETSVRAALDTINNIAERNRTEEINNLKIQLENCLEDNASKPMTLEETGEDKVGKLSVVDAYNLSEESRVMAETAADEALNKIIDYALETKIPNEVSFNIETDAELAKLVKGSNAGVVTEFICGQNNGNVLSLYFGGKDGWGQNAIFEVKVNTQDANYKYGDENASEYSNEIKGLIKEQNAQSAVYSNLANEGKYVNINYVTTSTSTKITYSVLSRGEDGYISAGSKVTLREGGQLTEEEVVAIVMQAVENASATYTVVFDGDEAE